MRERTDNTERLEIRVTPELLREIDRARTFILDGYEFDEPLSRSAFVRMAIQNEVHFTKCRRCQDEALSWIDHAASDRAAVGYQPA